MAVDHERLCLPDFEKNQYVYITFDQGMVEPQTQANEEPGGMLIHTEK